MAPEPEDIAHARRQGDVVLEQVRGELGVLSTKVELGAEATKSSIGVVTESVRRLEDKVDRVLAAQADPAASAGGRQLLEKIGELEKDRDTHSTEIASLKGFRTEAQTAFRTVRVGLVLVSTLLGIVTGAGAVVVLLHS